MPQKNGSIKRNIFPWYFCTLYLCLDYNLQALLLGKPSIAVCLPSTCDAASAEKSLSAVVDRLFGAFTPSPDLSFIADVGNYHYTSDKRPYTAGDIICM